MERVLVPERDGVMRDDERDLRRAEHRIEELERERAALNETDERGLQRIETQIGAWKAVKNGIVSTQNVEAMTERFKRTPPTPEELHVLMRYREQVGF